MIPICDRDHRSQYRIHLVKEKQCLYLHVVLHSLYIYHILTPLPNLPITITTDNSPVIKSDTTAAEKDWGRQVSTTTKFRGA